MRLLALLLFLAPFAGHGATNFIVRISTNQIAIPTPEGFVEVGLAERKSFPANSPNALLAWFVRTNDLQLLEPNATNFLKSHFQVQTVKEWTNKVMSARSFAKFVELTEKERAGDMTSVAEAVTKVFAENTNGVTAVDIAIPKQLGTIFKTERAYGALMLVGYTVPTKDGPGRVPMVAGNAVVRIGNKCLFLYCYEYVEKRELQKAMDAVRERLKPWVEATLSANPG